MFGLIRESIVLEKKNFFYLKSFDRNRLKIHFEDVLKVIFDRFLFSNNLFSKLDI